MTYNIKNIYCINPSADGENCIVKLKSRKGTFKTNFARLGPFLTSLARNRISRTIEPHLNNIVRVHTDGFMSNKPLFNHDELSTDIGKLKLEKTGSYKIINANKVIKL